MFRVIHDLGGFHVIQPADTRHHHSSHLHQFHHQIMNSGDCSDDRGALTASSVGLRDVNDLGRREVRAVRRARAVFQDL